MITSGNTVTVIRPKNLDPDTNYKFNPIWIHNTYCDLNRNLIFYNLKVPLEILECLALDQVEIVGLPQDSVLEAPAESLQVPVVNVEHVALHGRG